MTEVIGFIMILFSPLCMELPWAREGGAKSTIAKVCFVYVAGYFMRLTLFHAVAKNTLAYVREKLEWIEKGMRVKR